MSNESIIVLVAACSAVFIVAAWVGLLAVPAWQAYARPWERIAAIFLSLYTVLACMLVGAAVGALFVWFFAN
ncbi:unannotated protein [freshwater metagenome]|uniref:Unannotated protein n=1 Tax=freshwater metagenome TaxID=449393 RepID=A0A6J7DBM5_9ZZZZ|nr:hypothetical protein [Actinomycetota bacterium]